MKIDELLLENSPFAYMRELNDKFKAIAKEAGVVWLAGMGWPQVMKDGFWFGGGMKPSTRGDKDAVIRPGDLSPEATQKFIFKAIAAILEDAMKNGQQVKVANADRKASTEVVKPGDAYNALLRTVKVMRPPGRHDRDWPTVTWFIGKPQELSDAETVRLDITFPAQRGDPDYRNRAQMSIGTSLPVSTAKAFRKWYTNTLSNKKDKATGEVKTHVTPGWADDNQHKSTSDYKSYHPATKAWLDFEERLIDLAKKHGVKLPKNDDTSEPRARAFLNFKVLTKATKVIPPEEFLALFKEFPGA